MSNKLSLAVEKLKATIGAQDTRQAALLIESICQYFEDQLSDAEHGKLRITTFTKSFGFRSADAILIFRFGHRENSKYIRQRGGFPWCQPAVLEAIQGSQR